MLLWGQRKPADGRLPARIRCRRPASAHILRTTQPPFALKPPTRVATALSNLSRLSGAKVLRTCRSQLQCGKEGCPLHAENTKTRHAWPPSSHSKKNEAQRTVIETRKNGVLNRCAQKISKITTTEWNSQTENIMKQIQTSTYRTSRAARIQGRRVPHSSRVAAQLAATTPKLCGDRSLRRENASKIKMPVPYS